MLFEFISIGPSSGSVAVIKEYRSIDLAGLITILSFKIVILGDPPFLFD